MPLRGLSIQINLQNPTVYKFRMRLGIIIQEYRKIRQKLRKMIHSIGTISTQYLERKKTDKWIEAVSSTYDHPTALFAYDL